MTVDELLRQLRANARFMSKVAAWRTVPSQAARYAPLPAGLHPALPAALAMRGIDQLYQHQAETVAAALQGRNVAVVTPTASGKSLCYNLPVMHALLTEPAARALYLFPTKALAHDQLAELNRLAATVDQNAAASSLAPTIAETIAETIAAYDGDTPAAQRSRIRKHSRLLLTNPDMLHAGILPNHTQWADFLAGLRWVVVDEMHVYRGVFGSHVANVLRRLQRLCRHYGSAPRFLCTSATIANPAQLAERLIEQPVQVVDHSGAPRGEKHVILLNTPLVDAEKGIRRAATLEAADLAADCIAADLQTIVFGRSRLTTELLLTYLRAGLLRRRQPAWDQPAGEATDPSKQGKGRTAGAELVRGYRGGYLPTERRAIEAGLRSGAVRGVVATNALELGIDIGGLEAAILCGYPGSIASTWQQIGRAGRTTDAAVAMLVATAGLLDQYVIQHAEFLFEQSPEHALINPDNLMLLVDHMRCAASELPFGAGEGFGASPHVGDVLALLQEQGEVHQHGDRFFWSGASHPARQVSLRSAGADSVTVQSVHADAEQREEREKGKQGNGGAQVIGEVDQASAEVLVHDGAIYLHEGQSYLVRRLDLDARHADVTAVDVDYYTEAIGESAVAPLVCHAARMATHSVAAHGDVAVHSQVVGYRRIKRVTHETLGVYPLEYARRTLETSAYWCEITREVQQALEAAGLWFDSVNDYGPNWQAQRAMVRARDHYRCSACGAAEPPGREHDVHHKIPFRTYGYVPGLNDFYLMANRLENLMLLCRACHRRLETAGRLATGLDGLAYVLGNLAPLHLMCDRSDLGVYVARGVASGARADGARAPARSHRAGQDIDFYGSPAAASPPPDDKPPGDLTPRVYLYERTPAGLGFSALLYELHEQLLAAAHAIVRGCSCARGCPACVGPVLDEQPVQLETKRLTLALLARLAS
ncbi:MAG: DEAD/DEAH box helicase [Caldilineaceae bacterium]|jgi:DEAD/DEAH box helicase domain-containing protein|nr:DEAD/DEAH box helicase [Caldilineaceae bacterium]